MSKITTMAQAAAASLAYNDHLNEVFVTSDLEVFALKNDAIQHARKLDDKTIKGFNRDEDQDDDEEPAEVKLTAEATIKLIMSALSAEQVRVFLGDDQRKTVLAAAEKQLAILAQKALEDQAAEADRALAERNGGNPGGQQTDEDKANTDNQE